MWRRWCTGVADGESATPAVDGSRGCIYGASDDFAYHAAENPVHVRDLQATLLQLCGIHHDRLTYRHQGLDFKLTGVEEAQVVSGILA